MDVTFEQIKQQYEAECERARGRKLQSADELPLSYEEITPEWLTAILAGGHPQAKVASCTLGERDEGTSSRRRIHMQWNEAGVAAGLPTSVFCKGSLSLENRYILGMNGGIPGEVTFYNKIRPGLAIHAPVAFFARYDPATFNSIIVMHDMAGDVKFCGHDDTLDFEQAQSQMWVLAAFHGHYYENPALEKELTPPLNTWEKFFTITAEQAGFGPACERGVEQAEAFIPAPLFARREEIWPATLKCVDRHRQLPRTLVHSDVHLKNWLVAADGDLGVHDWQCTSKGNWSRDVSYALSTSLTIENRRAWERDLLAYYLEQLQAAGGARLAFEDAWQLYRQQLFAALAWWTGTLGQPPEAPEMQPVETSTTFIERMSHAIDDLDALDSF